MKKYIILYSGGMDSTVLLHLNKDVIKLALLFNYGSKHNDIENEYAIKNCDLLQIPYKVIKLDFNSMGITSNLLKNGGNIPIGSYVKKDMEKTVVPFRNGIMLSIAIGIAESKHYNKILIANHSGDHSIYPDCRPDFITSISKSANLGTYNNIEILSPFSNKSKKDIAVIGEKMKIDFSKSYSCYNGGKTHCGTCATCIERKAALKGFDNTEYIK